MGFGYIRHNIMDYWVVRMTLTCNLDGNCLCVVNDYFIDLQTSKAVFIELTEEQIKHIKELEEIENESKRRTVKSHKRD